MRFLTAIAIVFFVSAAYATEADMTSSRMQLANNICAASLDTVDVYMIPLEDFPEDISSTIANFMSDDMKLWAKATLRLGALNAASLPGTHQLNAEDIIEKAQPVIQRLPEASAKTYFILLTTQDINSYAGSTRFSFPCTGRACAHPSFLWHACLVT